MGRGRGGGVVLAIDGACANAMQQGDMRAFKLLLQLDVGHVESVEEHATRDDGDHERLRPRATRSHAPVCTCPWDVPHSLLESYW